MANTNSISLFIEKTWKRLDNLLKQKGFKTIVLDSERSLRKYIYDTIPDNCVVALGNSLSTSVLKIRDILLEKGNRVYYSWNGANNRSMDNFEEPPSPDYFLTTADTITPEGNLVNQEFSQKVAKEKGFPQHVIAFLNPKNINQQGNTQRIMGADYIVIDQKPQQSNVTVAMTSFA